MRLRFRINLRYFVLAVIALFSFGAIFLKQSDQYLQVSAAVQEIASVNAARQEKGPVAPGTLVSTFGNNLATRSEKSDANPPSTELAGVTIEVFDSKKIKHDAPIVYVSSKQINYLIPRGAALG